MLVLRTGSCFAARTEDRLEHLEVRRAPTWRKGSFIVGLTGGIGAGKSSTARAFEHAGAQVFNADAEARAVLMAPAMRHNLVAAFGTEILEAGEISRERVARLVFQDPAALQTLNGLIHPEVRRRFQAAVAALPDGSVFVYDVPLLYEAGLEKSGDFDLTVVVTAPVQERMARVRERNGWSESEFQAREAAQMPLSEKEKRADVLIRNTGTESDLDRMVERLLQEIKTARRKK